jgi:hypothetical protein
VRGRLVQFKRGTFTPDTVDALRKLEQRISKLRATVSIDGTGQLDMTWANVRQNPGPTGLPPEWSAIPTGREVYLKLSIQEDEGPDASRRERELAMLWAVAVPLGLVPFTRYPLPGPHDTVFHFFGGEWGLLMDHLLGAGRGEAGWPSFCCAAQIDVGKWEGGRVTERLVQAHLHRIGFNVGNVDGIVGNKTQGALRAANLHSIPMTEVAKQIVEKAPHVPEMLDRAVQGRIEMPDVDFSIHPYGQVRVTRTVRGADLQISGPGRVVLDVRDPPK